MVVPGEALEGVDEHPTRLVLVRQAAATQQGTRAGLPLDVGGDGQHQRSPCDRAAFPGRACADAFDLVASRTIEGFIPDIHREDPNTPRTAPQIRSVVPYG
jgi:hypothetical protein